LVADDDALGQWINLSPRTDSQQLRALVRQARKDANPKNVAQRPATAAPTARYSNWCMPNCPAKTSPMRPCKPITRPPPTPASTPEPAMHDPVTIGIVSVSDRASSGIYEDKGLPALKDWLGRALRNPIHWEARLIPDEQALISQTLIELVDAGCAWC